MKSEVLIIKNISREGSGLLKLVLEERGVVYSVVDLDKGEEFARVEDYGAVVVLGGQQSVNDENERMENELALIREALIARIPYLGICLGFQALVKAAGGRVTKSPVKEVGFVDQGGNNFTVELTNAGEQDPLFKGLGNKIKIFHLHGETVEITDEMKLLAAGKFCKNQVVRVGSNAYGIQGHFELTTEMFETWITSDPCLVQLDEVQLRDNFDSIKGEYTNSGIKIFRNFLDIAGF